MAEYSSNPFAWNIIGIGNSKYVFARSLEYDNFLVFTLLFSGNFAFRATVG